MVGAPSRWIRSPGIGNCQTGRPVSEVRQWRVPPASWCMPSPKTSRLPATAGDETDASRRYGADRDGGGDEVVLRLDGPQDGRLVGAGAAVGVAGPLRVAAVRRPRPRGGG